MNRATYENYAPGSIFKPIVGLAALENGLNPNEIYDVQPDPDDPDKGCIFVGARKIKDTVPPGEYNFRRAIVHSSNSYFIFNGLAHGHRKNRPPRRKISFWRTHRLADAAGNARNFPNAETSQRIRLARRRFGEHLFRPGRNGRDADANGRVPIPRSPTAERFCGRDWLTALSRKTRPAAKRRRIFPPASCAMKSASARAACKFCARRCFRKLKTREGTGRAAVIGLDLRICGKTGTAQVQDEHNQTHRPEFLVCVVCAV